MTEQKQTAKEFFEGFPEAPVSDTFKWVDNKGFEHMTTLRGYAVSAVFKLIDETGTVILENGGKIPNPRPSQTVQERDENGTPVIDGDGNPVMTNLPKGTGLYNVKQLFHGKTQNGKDFLGVVTVETPHNRKWGVKCFHPGNSVSGWQSWPVGENDPIYYAPPETAKRVIIREAKDTGSYPDVVEFRTGDNPF